MQGIFQRFDGSYTVQNANVHPDNDVVLIPRRDAFTGEVVDYMRFNKTLQTKDNLPLYVQSKETLDVKIDNRVIKIIPAQP